MNISVIIPVYNGEQYLNAAIDSVLAQACAAAEIIIIDDGSTDNTAKIVHNYGTKVIYHKQANLGVSAARNTGVRLAKSEYLIFLDHDDVYLPNHLADFLALFQKNPCIHVAGGKWRYLFASQRLKDAFPKHHLIDKETYEPYLGTHVFKKSIFETVGMFDESLNFGEDTDFLIRLKNHGIAVNYTGQLCYLYRYHETNTTKSLRYQTESKTCLLKILHKSIVFKRTQVNK